jgi:hypothetical protein
MKPTDLDTAIVALKARPQIPKGASRAETVEVISSAIDSTFRRFVEWLKKEEPRSEVERRKCPSISPLVTVHSTPEMISRLLSRDRPEEVETAERETSWEVS